VGQRAQIEARRVESLFAALADDAKVLGLGLEGVDGVSRLIGLREQ